MKDPIDHLLADHREIRSEIDRLRGAVATLRERGDAALPQARPALESVAHMMATRLLRHAHKEDDALFPSLERVFGSADGPTGMLRAEHRSIRERAGLFRKTLYELNEVEHPAIEARGAALGVLASAGATAMELAVIGEEIVSLLDAHFAKEEDILFPMARDLLSDSDLAEVARLMHEIEASA